MATYTRPNLGGSWEQGDDASAVARPNLAGSWEQAGVLTPPPPTVTLSNLEGYDITSTGFKLRLDYDFA